MIASHRASTPEVIRDGVTGFLCHTEDEMVAAVRSLPQLDRATCRRDVQRRFDAPVVAQQCLSVLEGLQR